VEVVYDIAVRDALAEEMRRDPLVWVLGEDLTTSHGSTSADQYLGLVDEFGPKRVVNTPISENTIMGAGVGAAVAGTRPIADLRQVDFGVCAMDELVQQAAKIRYMFGGQARVPLVIRQMMGSRAGLAAQHCLSNEAWFVHTAGLIVVAPATPADGRGLLKSSIRCDDPVVFLEHRELWKSTGDIDEQTPELVPLGEAKITRPGSDVTIVAWSKMSLMALQAAEELSKDGIEAEVIDLRTLWPWDRDRVLQSVEKTGRLLVAQESVQVAGLAGEIAMSVMEHINPEKLKTPVKRIGAPRIPVGYSPALEAEFRVTDKHVAETIREMFV
jgi:pyruvate/2-oxoglutarate/acetoin dehydrogenase E1 component